LDNKYLHVKILYLLSLFTFILSCSGQNSMQEEFFKWDELAALPAASGQDEPLGVAGPFAGISSDALIIAGGANFPKPYWGMDKAWHDDIWVLEKNSSDYQWFTGFKLDKPAAYGMSVTTEYGVVCIGGADAQRCSSEVFLLKWDRSAKSVIKEDLPPLPQPCAYGGAAVFNDIVYVCGGQSSPELDSAMKNFWSLDLSQKDSGVEFSWQQMPAWPGPQRAFNMTVAQHNGKTDCIYIISGRKKNDVGIEFLRDIYEFSIVDNSWKQCASAPRALCAGSASAVGQSHIFVYGGDDGSLFLKADELGDNHPGFAKDIFAYHTITDTWIKAGEMPQTQVTSVALKWDDGYFVVSGEIRPRVRTPEILRGKLRETYNSFGAVNFITLSVYLLAMVGVGVYFSTRNKNTDDFFRGGQRLPAWAAGLSIFATMLSSITFVAIPAKVYSTDWTFFTINMMAIAVTPFVIFLILPFFRDIDATSAYEYLEKRFNVFARLFASFSFVLFQIGRMAIVMFLPALALSTITSFSVEQCILIMGVLSVIYCTMGGLEAVIWTDSIQTFILLGGALVSIIIIFLNIDGGVGEFFAVANENAKFHTINWDFSSTSFMTTSIWVMVLGGIGQNLVPYVSDQAVVQRYLSVSDTKKARKSILTNALIIIPASLLFFGVGTALFVFYKMNPDRLDPNYQNDAIFPMFIARELPIGISGLVVAGIFAAAQSTVSTSMNSISTVVVTDFVKRFSLLKTEKGYLNLARFCTLFFGTLGTLLALLFASADIKSLWESFMSVLGLFGGSMCGLFLLGIFTNRVGGISAIAGALIGAVVLFAVKINTGVSVLLYAAIGILACTASSYALSFVIPEKRKDIAGLTVFKSK
jgi:solute:Na+ symporter, SSS family